jgi:hypothetical protein
MSTNETNPTPNDPDTDRPAPVTSYALTDEERLVFQTISKGILIAKHTVYELNMQLEQAMKERDRTEAQFSGALALLSTAHKLQAPAAISPDFTRIETQKG